MSSVYRILSVNAMGSFVSIKLKVLSSHKCHNGRFNHSLIASLPQLFMMASPEPPLWHSAKHGSDFPVRQLQLIFCLTRIGIEFMMHRSQIAAGKQQAPHRLVPLAQFTEYYLLLQLAGNCLPPAAFPWSSVIHDSLLHQLSQQTVGAGVDPAYLCYDDRWLPDPGTEAGTKKAGAQARRSGCRQA